jgi:hypothetical protein
MSRCGLNLVMEQCKHMFHVNVSLWGVPSLWNQRKSSLLSTKYNFTKKRNFPILGVSRALTKLKEAISISKFANFLVEWTYFKINEYRGKRDS